MYDESPDQATGRGSSSPQVSLTYHLNPDIPTHTTTPAAPQAVQAVQRFDSHPQLCQVATAPAVDPDRVGCLGNTIEVELFFHARSMAGGGLRG